MNTSKMQDDSLLEGGVDEDMQEKEKPKVSYICGGIYI